MIKPNFRYKTGFEIGPCLYKGKKDFCNGKFNGPKCLVKYAFFGFILSCNGWKNRDTKTSNKSCPEYVEWRIKWKEKDEFIGITNGGQLEGFKLDVAGPCIFQEMKFTNKEVKNVLAKLFDLVQKKEIFITRYLATELSAPKGIRESAINFAKNYHAPRIKN